MPRYLRFENHRSADKRLSRRVIVEGLQKNFDKGDNIRIWLGRYGSVEEIERFRDAVVVKFASEEQASQAVECENRIRKPGSNIRVQLANSDTLRQLQTDYSRKTRRSLKSRRGHRPLISDRLPRKHQSRSVLSSLSSSPTIDFTRENNEDTKKEIKISIPSLACSQSILERTKEPCVARKNDIVILAVSPDLISYAREFREFIELHAMTKGPDILQNLLKEQPQKRARLPPDFAFRRPQILEYTIISDSHIEPSLVDFTVAGTLYAFITTELNKRYRTCTLRILQSTELQEHRNMLRFEAIELMLKNYAECIVDEAIEDKENTENKSPKPPKTPPSEISEPLQPPLLTKSEVILPTLASVPDQLKNQPEVTATTPVKKPRKRHHSSSSQLDSESSSDSSSEETGERCCRSSHKRNCKKFTRRTKGSFHRKNVEEEMEGAMEIPLPDDPSFIQPSKRMSVLLRMLADSRVLSIAELDEVLAFVTRRKIKLVSDMTKEPTYG